MKILQPKELTRSLPEDGILVDLDLLYCPLDERWHVLSLRAMDQDCTMNLWVRAFRAAEICAFGKDKTTIRSIYEVFSAAITSVGASFDSITIDSSEGHGSAVLKLSSPSRSIQFPRSADAVMFALVANIPIYATEQALCKVSDVPPKT